jgi:hypothetical protein
MTTYQFTNDLPITAWPEGIDRLVELHSVAKPSRNGASPSLTPPDEQPRWVAQALVSGVDQPGRNQMATQLAGYFHSVGVPRDIILATLKGFADACNPPFDYTELHTVIGSVVKYAPSRRRSYTGENVAQPLSQIDALGITRVWWPETGVHFTFGRISRHSDGARCQVDIETIGTGHIFGPILINLLTDHGRKSRATELAEIEEHNWLAYQKSAFREALHLDKSGGGFRKLTPRRAKTARHIAYPVLRTGEPTIIVADGGTGKSLFALALEASVSTGQSILPGIRIDASMPCFYLDWETDEEAQQERLALLGAEAPDQLHYQRMRAPLRQTVDQLVPEISKEPSLTVIDSVLPALGADINEAESARLFFEALRLLDTTPLILAHVNKEGKLFGSVFFANLARSVWVMKKVQEHGDNSTTVAFYHRKANNDRLHPPIGYRIAFTPDAITFNKEDVGSVPELEQHMSIRARMRALLGRGDKMLPREVADELSLDPARIRTELNRNKKMFGADPGGRYFLLAEGASHETSHEMASQGGRGLRPPPQGDVTGQTDTEGVTDEPW